VASRPISLRLRSLLRRLAGRLERIADPGRSTSKLMVTIPDRRPLPPPEGRLAAVAIFRNEARYLPEWLTFHRLSGVEHVYLYDNGSTDDAHEVLEPYVRDGFVTVTDWPLPWPIAGSLTTQFLAYAHAVHTFGADWRWMTFIDIDEFLFTPAAADGTIVSLCDVLADYDDLPVMTLHMTMFGSNGHAQRPQGLVIEDYPAHAPFPVKSMPKVLCDPRTVRAIGSAHYFVTDLGTGIAFDEKRRLVRAQDSRRRARTVTPVSERLRLHHYFIRSQEDWARKVTLRHHNYPRDKLERLIAHGRDLDAASNEVCPLIVPFIGPVRAALAAAAAPVVPPAPSERDAVGSSDRTEVSPAAR
jgi:hypothetical protein